MIAVIAVSRNRLWCIIIDHHKSQNLLMYKAEITRMLGHIAYRSYIKDETVKSKTNKRYGMSEIEY
jgi:hypothetical protein